MDETTQNTPLETQETAHDAVPETTDRETTAERTKRLNAEYFETWRRLALLYCEAYVRRYPERCARIGDTTWRPIDIIQLTRANAQNDILFAESCTAYQEFFNTQNVRTLEDTMRTMMETLAELKERRQTAQELGVPLVIERIGDSFELSRQEIMLLMIVALSAMDSNVYRAMALAWGNCEIQKVRVDFLCDLCSFSREMAIENQELLSDRGQLVRMRLLIPERDITTSGTLPRMFAYLGIDQRVIDALRNADITANLPPHMQLMTMALKPRGLMVPQAFSKQLKLLMGQPQMRILLTGPQHGGRRTSACSYAKNVLNRNTVVIDFLQDIDRLPENQIETHFCELLRDALLLNSTLLMRFDTLGDNPRIDKMLEDYVAPLSKHIEHYPGTIILTAKQNAPLLNKLFTGLTECCLPLPTPKLQEQVWQNALTGIFDDETLAKLSRSYANNYQLPVGQILNAVQRCLDAHYARTTSPDEIHIASHHILEEIRKCFDHDLGTLADVVLSDIPISRVILPEETAKQVTEILHFAQFQRMVLDDWGYRACSSYGNSLSILFAGPPGTGKTLLATAMANELGKILYRVDLSRIVDKYVGETEKNLAKLFDEAAKAQAILLFDEADSLFAKRTDVKSSNDRYANLEVNFLIQKLESYEGISILTTNLQSSIDEAFKRRLRYIVEFREPDLQDRIRLWKNLIAPKTPLMDDINWRILAENFELSGGHIRNATLNASIRAAAKGEALGMQYLLEAAIEETRKLGKLVRLNDKVLLILDSYGVEIL